jgi:hypothetical protein
MTLVYCSIDKRDLAVKQLGLSKTPHEFVSPTAPGINHYATRVIICGNHPSIAERYKGIAKVDTVSLQPEPDSNDEEE